MNRKPNRVFPYHYVCALLNTSLEASALVSNARVYSVPPLTSSLTSTEHLEGTGEGACPLSLPVLWVHLDCKAFTLEQEVNLKEDAGNNMALVERQGKGMLRPLLPAGGSGCGRDGKSEASTDLTAARGAGKSQATSFVLFFYVQMLAWCANLKSFFPK